ncbi:MAG TPA: hypothetical protein DDZ84_05865, partial [Firmicutes bacterium]|nr:hypothetical protein [Bacillota bacterium]
MITATQGQTATGTVTFSNTGEGELRFEPHLEDDNAPLAMKETQVGKPIKAFRIPYPMTDIYGVAVNYRTDELILGDYRTRTNYVVTSDGVYTGKTWRSKFAGRSTAGMVFDGRYVWQLDEEYVVGHGNGIHAIDPTTGKEVARIKDPDGVWDRVDQKGIAYDPKDDTFYVAGYNESRIYHIKGLSWDNPGEILENRWRFPVVITGMAYHPEAEILVVVCMGEPDMVYYLDPATQEIVDEFPCPTGTYWGVGGCDLDADGNLWIASLEDKMMYLMETGLGPLDGWLSWNPRRGSVAPENEASIEVTVDARRMEPGFNEARMVLNTNDPEHPMVAIPVMVEVVRPPVITEVNAQPCAGESPLTVAFSAAFEETDAPIASCRWEFGDGTSEASPQAVHIYSTMFPRQYTATFTVTDELGGTARAGLVIDVGRQPRATVSEPTIEVEVPANGTASTMVSIGNLEGTAPLDFRVRVKNGESRVGEIGESSVQGALGVGDVISYIQLPEEIYVPFAVALDLSSGDIWVRDEGTLTNHVITPWGEHTGRIMQTLWQDSWASGLVYDQLRGLMWQLNVDGDNAIYGLDSQSGRVVQKITTVPWSIPQMGLAHNSVDDTFYAGSMWNPNLIYHIKGPSWDNPGEAIEQWQFHDSVIGLAWHPDGMLWISTNSRPDMIYAVDPTTRNIVHEFRHPGGGNGDAGGIAINDDGNLLAACMSDGRIYVVNTGMPVAQGIVADPARGTIASGESSELSISINAAGLGQGGDEVRRHLAIETNDAVSPVIHVDLLIRIKAGPKVAACTASVTVGEPPLSVEFEAEVEAGEAPIRAAWWDFGDGSDPASGLMATHVYSELGTYQATFYVVDEAGIEVAHGIDVTVKWLPSMAIVPGAIQKIVPWGTEHQENVTIANVGNAPLRFTLRVLPTINAHNESSEVAGLRTGGPDHFGYIWADSDDPDGPEFDWVEISEIGTRLGLRNEDARLVELPFEFPFYGRMRTTVGISSNGYLSFDENSLYGYWLNSRIPGTELPNDLLAVFWDDLNPQAAGAIYCYSDTENERFIVEFQDVPRISDIGMLEPEGFTFQVIFEPDGSILYQYLSMPGVVDSATIGIENERGDDGLEIAYNAPYVKDGLAIRISPVASLVRLSANSGYLHPGTSDDIAITFGSSQAHPGSYSLKVHVSSNDPRCPETVIPVALKINVPPSIRVLVPVTGEVWSGERTIRWRAEDPDDSDDVLSIDLYWSRDGGEWNEIAKGLANTGSYMWNTASVGLGGDAFRVRIVVTDPAGETAETISEPFTIINDAPTAAFSFLPSPAMVTSIVEFVDESTDDGEITAWHWEFGDG